MEVTLMHHTPLGVCSHAVRTCWQSFGRSDQGGPKDRELIERVGNKFKHSSTLEHLVYSFYIQGISRALLQELARHRIASLSVKSTRYTLKELEEEKPLVQGCRYDAESDRYDIDISDTAVDRAKRYIVLTGNTEVDHQNVVKLDMLRTSVQKGIPNDISKFELPDAYKTELTWTINARSLQNFLKLRTSTSAMWEIRRLAYAVYDALPEDHKYLFGESVYEEQAKAS